MLRHFIPSSKPLLPITCTLTSHFSSFQSNPIGTPTRVQKLIASQSDPLLAKEIFEYASLQPSFRHTFSSYLILILKLGRSNHFNLVEKLVLDLKLKHHYYPINPTLFSYLIKIYSEAKLPDKVLKTFYTIREFKSIPKTKHLNQILETLVSYKSYVRPACDLFKEAHKHGCEPNTSSYNILMRAFSFSGEISVSYKLFGEMFRRDLVPNVESYRILMQGLCRKSQVNCAVELLEDMLNKGYVPDSLIYTSLLNSLCRKKKIREAYKLLCRMKIKGCNPDIVHYNTVIVGFCREGRAIDACKVIDDMETNGCLPNSVSYRSLVCGLCDQGMFDEGLKYWREMVAKGFSPHFSVSHGLVKGLCSVGRSVEGCRVVEELMKHGESPHLDTWAILVPTIPEVGDMEKVEERLERALKVDIKGGTRIVDAVGALEEYLIKKGQLNKRRV